MFFYIIIELSQQIFEKCTNIKFYIISPNGSLVFASGQTYRHRQTWRSFSQFCK